MTTVLQAIENVSQSSNRLAFVFSENPEIVGQLFEPLYDSGIQSFITVADGTNALILGTDVNPNIVFRATSEDSRRSSRTPFFLTSPYTHAIDHEDENIRLELLLKGNPIVKDEQWKFLMQQMALAGWETDRITELGKSSLIRDTVIVSIRGADSRVKTVPIISDPSALERIFNLTVGLGANWNVCGPDYPTLQDQAAAYNRIIDNDDKLKKLVPQLMKLPETQIRIPGGGEMAADVNWIAL